MYRSTITSAAASYIGERGLYTFPWCARFISKIYSESGLSKYFYGGQISLSCSKTLNWYKKNLPDQVGYNLNAMRPGDIVYFDFKGKGKPNHCGIFKQKINSSDFYTIEGNTSGTSAGSQYSGNTVQLKKRSILKVHAFVHIVFPGENPYPEPTRTLQRGLKGSDVSWLQYYLKKCGFELDIDGSFGPKTEQVLRNAQYKLGLEVDGKCGGRTRNTLKELFEYAN